MKVIGLTGGSGCGKTTAADMFRASGFSVIDADKLAREAVIPGSECIEKLSAFFGKDILNPDGSLNRARLAGRAFKDEKSTLALNAITHPFILAKLREKLNSAREKNQNTVIDAPLLYESGLDAECDAVVAVVCDRTEQFKRLMIRDGADEKQITLRLDRQAAQRLLLKKADFIIDNSGSPEIFKENLHTIINILMSE